MKSKFSDIGHRKESSENKEAIKKIVNGGSVEVKAVPVSEKKTPLQVMLNPALKNEIKAIAAMRGIKLNELFLDMYDFYKRNHESMKK